MAAPLVRRTTAAALVGALAALAACGGGSGGSGEEEAPQGIPVPAKVKGYGTIEEPALDARWLEESTGTQESTDYSGDGARSGTVLTEDLVVTYGRDIVSAVDRASGETRWQSDLDMGGETVCDITEPTSPEVDHLTVMFGDNGYCTGMARISVADGTAGQVYRAGEREFSGDRFVGLATHDGVDYVAETYGAISTFDDEQVPQEVTRVDAPEDLSGASVAEDAGVLVVLSGNLLQGATQVLHGLRLPDLEEVWRTPVKDLAPARVVREGVQLHPSDGRFLTAQVGATYHLIKIDGETGKAEGVISTDYRKRDPSGESDELLTDLVDQQNAPETFGRVGDDVVLNNTARGLSRVSMDGTIRWTYKPNITLREGNEYPLLVAGPVTDDGRQMLATVTNGRSADLLLLDTGTGRLKGRWVVPEEYVAGFAGKPYLRLVGDEGVLMARNQTLYGDTEFFDQEADTRKPYDAGYFTFPAVKGG